MLAVAEELSGRAADRNLGLKGLSGAGHLRNILLGFLLKSQGIYSLIKEYSLRASGFLSLEFFGPSGFQGFMIMGLGR